jgi:putative hemin transport protein
MNATAQKIENNSSLPASEILEKYNHLKSEQPDLRPKNAAEAIGVSEAALVSARIDQKTIFRLNNEPKKILLEAHKLGEVMALTRNESCVHERKGVYNNVSFQEGHMNMGLAVNADIDLRLFMNHWKHSFAVTEQTKAGAKKSIQFYGNDGLAIHKIYLTPKSNEVEYDKLVEALKAEDQSLEFVAEALPAKRGELPDSQVDAKSFEADLANMKDTHDFYILLQKHRIGRTQSYRLISNEYATKVANDSTRKTLELARDKNCEIMVFVGNRGCLQIHTGKVEKLVEFGGFYNVLDPMFNLHLKEEDVASSWIVRKPTEDGIVTSLEIFDKNEELIATLFGKRKPGIPELALWREITAEIASSK